VDMAVHAYNLCTQEAEARGMQVEANFGLAARRYSKKKLT
jgi:hypothetical protein